MEAINGHHWWTQLMDTIKTQKTKCASRGQVLGFVPYMRTWEGRKLQIDKVRTWLAQCASRVQVKCTLKSTPGRIVCTLLVPNPIKPTLLWKTKCASRAQVLGFVPYLQTWEGRKSQNQQSAHLACEVRN